MSQWTNLDAGPIQAKRVLKALSGLSWEGKTFVELHGVIGQPETERRTTLTSPFGTVRPDVAAAIDRIGQKFDWQITAKNHKEIIEAVSAELVEAVKTRPTDDQREDPEVVDRRNAEAMIRNEDEKALREARDWLKRDALAQKPAGAEAIILAELQEDKSDSMTDYHANQTVRCVAIGWRFGKREDFRQLKAAAAKFPETAHLASQEALNAWAASNGRRANLDLEHRDNYSMGAGNYLSDHDASNWGSGWVVKSTSLSWDWGWNLTELAFPEQLEELPETGSASAEGITIRPSSTGRAGFVEVIFDQKPSFEVLSGLKAHGFRWARHNRCWYGRDEAYAKSLLPADATASA